MYVCVRVCARACVCVCVFAFVFVCMCRGKLDLQCLGECEGSGAADPAS